MNMEMYPETSEKYIIIVLVYFSVVSASPVKLNQKSDYH